MNNHFCEIPSNKRFKNLLNEIFDDLTVIKYWGISDNGKEHFWFCRCVCGNIMIKSSSSLKVKDRYQRCNKCTTESTAGARWEYYLNKFKSVHGDKYDYNKASFINSKDPIEIICPLHGSFKQAPYDHSVGKECSVCGRLKANASHRNSFEVFLERAISTHGDKYSYDKVDYISSSKKVVITCKEHGDFKQTPKGHWSGRGCPVCRYISSSEKLTKSTEDFINDANKVHGDKYSYENVNYLGSTVEVEILCKNHGVFHQKPSIHLNGFGCGKCSTRGYNGKNGGSFYIIDLNGEFIKYGITSKDVSKRKCQQESGSRFIHDILYDFFFEDGEIPKLIEREVKRTIERSGLTKEDLEDGYTETVDINRLEDILNIVYKYKGIK